MERTAEVLKGMRTVLRNLGNNHFKPIPKSRRLVAGSEVKGYDFYAVPGIELDRKVVSNDNGYRAKILVAWKDGGVGQLEVQGRYIGDTVEEFRMGRSCEPEQWNLLSAYHRLVEMALPQAA